MKTPQQPELKQMDGGAILVVSLDPSHSDVRREVLEKAGFEVAAVSTLNSLVDACNSKRFSLVIIGFSISPMEKIRIISEMKKCYEHIPILELHSGRLPDIDNQAVAYSFRQSAASAPDAFLATVKSILGGYYQEEKLTGT